MDILPPSQHRPGRKVYDYVPGARGAKTDATPKEAVALRFVLTSEGEDHPHVWSELTNQQLDDRMYGITLRQFTNPWYTNNMADDDYLKVLEKYYEVQPVEVDGSGYSLFNAAFASLWCMGREQFDNGQLLFQEFVHYCHGNHSRLERQYHNVEALTFKEWLQCIVDGHPNMVEQTDLLRIVSEFMQINLMVFQCRTDLNSSKMYRPAGKHSGIATIAVYYSADRGDHYIALVPKPDRNTGLPARRQELVTKLDRIARGETSSKRQRTVRHPVGDHQSTQLRPASQDYTYDYTPLDQLPRPVDAPQGGVLGMDSVRLIQPRFDLHRHRPHDFDDHYDRLDDIEDRMLSEPHLAPDKTIDKVSLYHKLEPVQADGRGFCPFNATFISLHFSYPGMYRNGEHLYQEFLDYLRVNKQRLLDHYSFFLDVVASTTSDPQLLYDEYVQTVVTGDKDCDRKFMLVVLAEFLKVNIIVFSNNPYEPMVIYSPRRNLDLRLNDGIEHDTIAIFNYSEAAGHFIGMVPLPPAEEQEEEYRPSSPEITFTKRQRSESPGNPAKRQRQGEDMSAIQEMNRLLDTMRSAVNNHYEEIAEPKVQGITTDLDTLVQSLRESRGPLLEENMIVLSMFITDTEQKFRQVVEDIEKQIYEMNIKNENYMNVFLMNVELTRVYTERQVRTYLEPHHKLQFRLQPHVYFLSNYFGVHYEQMYQLVMTIIQEIWN